jgi:exonuclease SbcC
MNLASLVGSFAIDLECGPLGRAGLFAITGPTAAGKSTLLDAICLALFDEIPRLRAAPKHQVGEGSGEAVQAHDVRAILSRGTGTGHAEVEFLGRDGERYVARWEVHRAGGKHTGTLQKQALSLKDACGLSLGGTKTETLAAIRDKVGLTFEQFCRSALLAQGDFAAFVRADAKERASLLEQMTGTELFTELSRMAHERAKVEKDVLKDLARKQETVDVLSEEERARHQAERDAAAARRKAAEAERAAAAGALGWHQTEAKLDAQVHEAHAEVRYAEDKSAAAASDRQTLALVEAAQPLRSLVAEHTRTHRDAAEARAELAEAGAQLESARQDVARTAGGADAAGRAAEAAEAARAEAQPRLAEARRLEVELGAAQRDLAQARAGALAATDAAGSARKRLDAKLREQTLADRARRQAEVGLAAHAHDEVLAREWPRWKAELERAVEAQGKLAAVDRLHPELDRAVADANARLAAAAADASTAAAALGQREADAQAARAAADEARAAAPPGGRARLLEQRARLDDLTRLARQAGASRDAEAAQRERAVQHRAAAEAARQKAAAAASALARTQAEHAAESTNLERARATRDLAAHRADLVAGEPCPLCGATEHPYASALPPLDALLAQLGQRVLELKGLSDRALQDRTAAETEEQTQARAVAEAEAAAAHAATKRIAHEASWRSLRAEEPDVRHDSPLDEGVLPGLEALLADLANRISTAKAAEEAAVRLASEEKAALDRLEAGRKALARANKAQADGEAAARQAADARASAEVDRARWAEVEQVALAAVAPAFRAPTGQPALDLAQGLRKDPRGFVAQAERRAADFTKLQVARDEATRLLATLDPEVTALREWLEDLDAQAATTTQRRDDLARTHADVALRLEATFDGRTAADVERELDARRTSAGNALKAAEASLAAARAAEAGAEAAVGTRTDARLRLDQAHAAAVAGLDHALTARGWSREHLDALLTRDEAWLKAQRTRLADLDRAVTQSCSVLAERERQRAVHVRSGPPGLTLAEAQTSLATSAAALALAEEDLKAHDLALGKDDEARVKKARFEAEAVDRTKAADVVLRLGALIGSSDGSKLRVFAQGLTFEALLAHANEHLKLLRPRYRLARVPGADMNFQVVDVDLGDVARSVNGLSGGETFLVSLALALALSSLSSKDTRVESLFIDEGFGTLDPETLDEALDALDTLQAAGRKVGVISHVSGMAEHIGARVEVIKLGNGRSRVQVAGASAPAAPASTGAETASAAVKKKRGRPRKQRPSGEVV